MAYGYSGYSNSSPGSDPMAGQKQYWDRSNPAGSSENWYEYTKGMYRPAPEAFDTPGGAGPQGSYVKGYAGMGFMAPQDEDKYRSWISQGYGLAGASRGDQERMLDYIKAVAEGNLGGGRKTLAQQAQEQSLAQIQASSTAAARSGASPALQRAAMYQGGAASQQAAASGALASMKEQQDAQRLALQAAGQMRTQDIQQAVAAQQGLLSSTQAESMKKEMTAKYIALGLSDREAERRANMALEAMRMQSWESQQGRAMQQSAIDQSFWNSLLGGGIAAGGALLAAFSDKRGKKDIERADMRRYLTSCAGAKTGITDTTGFLDDLYDEPGVVVSNVDEPGVAGTKATPATTADNSAKYKAAGGALTSFGTSIMAQGKNAAQDMIQAAGEKNQERMNDLFNSLMSMPGGTYAEAAPAAVSDMSAKEGETPVNDFMDALQAYRYRYKEPEKHGRGERIGVMAQDMEKSKLGDSLIVKDSKGLRHIDMDPQKFNPLVLASLADLNKRLRKVESEG
jgi:hypothetical protein